MKIYEWISKLKHISSDNFFLIAGPCVVEDEDMCWNIAEKIFTITNNLEIPFIFKASYKKANRSRLDSFAGIGDKTALEIIQKVGRKFDVPVLTDIHTPEEAIFAAYYVDILQIPAFLCRQTELLVAAAKTGKVVNIKKGQFLAPESMKYTVNKILQSGNDKILLTDRGTMFGYRDLIVDFRGLVEMKILNFPVVLDVTHSLQKPNLEEGVSGGQPEYIESIARAGIAVGVDGLFLETHPDPVNAKSDGANMLHLELLEDLLKKLCKLRKVVGDI